jgi:hypothetical protein
MQENVAMVMPSVGVQTLFCLSIHQVTQAKACTPTQGISSNEAILKLPQVRKMHKLQEL